MLKCLRYRSWASVTDRYLFSPNVSQRVPFLTVSCSTDRPYPLRTVPDRSLLLLKNGEERKGTVGNGE